MPEFGDQMVLEEIKTSNPPSGQDVRHESRRHRHRHGIRHWLRKHKSQITFLLICVAVMLVLTAVWYSMVEVNP